MENPNSLKSKENIAILKSKTANAFTTGSLVVLGLFVVFSYGFAACVLLVDKDIISKPASLIWGFVLSTPIFLGIGFRLVACLHKKYYIGGQIKLLSKNQESNKGE